MTTIPELPANAFAKLDPAPDRLFYALPRFVTHIDAGAIAAVTALYRKVLPPDGTILDLMSSWVSHLPDEVRYAAVIGHGLNADELAANPRLDRSFVQDLNADPVLPLDDACVDAVTCCVSVQYLQQPVAVMRELRRIIRPGGCVVFTFSNRCFPTKAIAIWSRLGGAERVRLVGLCLEQASFPDVQGFDLLPEGGLGDPLHAVVARAASAKG